MNRCKIDQDGRQSIGITLAKCSQLLITPNTESGVLSLSPSCCRSRSDKDCFHHLTVALHLSLCLESGVHLSIFMSELQASLYGILELETRASSLSVTRRQLIIENLFR